MLKQVEDGHIVAHCTNLVCDLPWLIINSLDNTTNSVALNFMTSTANIIPKILIGPNSNIFQFMDETRELLSFFRGKLHIPSLQQTHLLSFNTVSANPMAQY